jgi:sulfite exporter TauE/SafE
MAKKDTKNTPRQNMLFGKRNYKFMFTGLFFIALGFILMSGGGSKDPNTWNEAIFNFRRIRLAPMLVLLGMAIEIYAILTKTE